MKKSILFLLIISSLSYVKAQNTPVVEKAAPQSNNALPSGGTLGSNSGVNPMGNPGTIANSSGSNSAINSTLAPHPNIEPGTFLSSSPEGTVVTTTITNGSTVTKTATTTTTNGNVTAVVNEPVKAAVQEPVAVEPITAVSPAVVAKTEVSPSPVPIAKNKSVSTRSAGAKDKLVTITDRGKTVTYKPLLTNYVSEKVVNKIKEKYGADVYDIRTVRIASTNKIAYLVRLLDDGKLKSELYYDEL